jgi:hypothetical protein
MSYHVYLFKPGKVEDIDALKAVWAKVVDLFDTLPGEPCEGEIAGGDWVGDDRGQENPFTLSAHAVRGDR